MNVSPASPPSPAAPEIERIRDSAEKVLARRRPRIRLAAIHLGLSAALVVLFYSAEPLWGLWPRLHQILFERSWWSHVIAVVALLALADLLLKWILDGLLGGFDPQAAGLPRRGRLTPGHMARLAAFIENRPWYRRHGAWDRRLATGLLQFARGESKAAVRDTLRAQAEVDEASLASRYTVVKLLLWAIPLLGFIGTVEGIGAGVGHFSLQLSEHTSVAEPAPGPVSIANGASGIGGGLDQVRGSLQEVTGGLGRAFDTTYLALVLAVVLMLGMALLEKTEVDRMLDFDEYCQVDFAARLPLRSQLLPEEVRGLADSVESTLRSLAQAERTAATIAGVGATLDLLNERLRAGVDLKLTMLQPGDEQRPEG